MRRAICLLGVAISMISAGCRTASHDNSAVKDDGQMITAGAQILSAKLTNDKKGIALTVRHGGGCGKHEYKLKVGSCLESMPVQCGAELIHHTNDFCEGLLTRDIVISLEEARLNDKYYSKATLTISGSDNSKAEIRLPEIATATPAAGTATGTPATTSDASQPNEQMFNGGGTVTDAKITTDQKGIEISVGHAGGCGKHNYALKMGKCLETRVVQCTAQLIHMTNDPCEALLQRHPVITFKEAGLNKAYYSKASLTIEGDDGSSATVTLPKLPN